MSETREQRKKDFFTPFVAVVCVVLAVLVVLLARQNMKLKEQISAMAAAGGAGANVEKLEPGDAMETIDVIDPSGAEASLRFDQGGESTLLLVFSKQCPACAQMMPYWNDLYARVGDNAPRMLAIRLDGEPEAVEAPYPIHRLDHAKKKVLAKIPYIPATVLVDGQGVVQQAWFGVPDASARGEIERVVGL